jgi:uncharacterized protein (TIRG00374 family)
MVATPVEDGAVPMLRGWRYQTVVWSVLLSTVAYLAFVLWGGGGWQSLVESADRFGLAGIALILGLSLVNYVLRHIRWELYLRRLGHRLPWWRGFTIYMAGFALTTTPARIGQALRCVLLKPRGVPYSASLTAMLSERISDVLAILLLALAGLTVYPLAQPLVALGAAGIAAMILVLSSRRLLDAIQQAIRGEGPVARILRKLAGVLVQARVCHAPRLFAWAAALSLVAWSAEAWSFYLVLEWMGEDVGPMLAMSFYAIAMLAGAVSFMPGGIGGAEATMIVLLNLAGVGTTEAIAATVVIRIATLWFSVGLGAIFLVRLARTEGGQGH